MLCAGTERVAEVPDTGTSLTRLIAFDEVSCHTCALAPAVNPFN